MMLKYLIILCVITCCGMQGYAQDSTSMKKMADKYVSSVSSKANELEKKLDKQSLKVLKKMQKMEAKLQGELCRKDSVEAKRLFGNSAAKYKEWEQKLTQPGSAVLPQGNQYMAYLDTVNTSFRFLDQSSLLGSSAGMSEKLQSAQAELGQLGTKFSQATAFQQFLKERRQYLKERLANYGMVKQLKSMNKEVYYYSQAIRDYKEMFRNKKKIEAKALSLLRESSAFKKFMQNNSQLASMFGLASAGGAANTGSASFAGLQTRAAIQQQLSNTAIMGGNSQQFLSQQLQTANQQLSQQKNSLRFPSIQDNLGEMPDFKPNQQKTKSFRQRLEYGMNIQFGKTNNFLPSTGEIAATVGYKLNDNGTIGAGVSYKLGLGSGFNHIRFSSQGYGLRSFIDWKIKGSFYLSGGYEKNYLPQLTGTEAPVPGLEAWQESGLIGVMKKYPIGKKRKGTIQVLFDFLSYKNVPRSRPVVFRTGINF